MRWGMIALAALMAGQAAADPVYDMCVRSGTYGHEQCDCTASSVANTFSADERELFGALAVGFEGELDAGATSSEAWDGAVQGEAMRRGIAIPDLTVRTDDLGQRYLAIRDGCGG